MYGVGWGWGPSGQDNAKVVLRPLHFLGRPALYLSRRTDRIVHGRPEGRMQEKRFLRYESVREGKDDVGPAAGDDIVVIVLCMDGSFDRVIVRIFSETLDLRLHRKISHRDPSLTESHSLRLSN